MSHVFISYSKKDVAYVRRLVEMLRQHGFDVWIDDRNLRSSEDWWQSIVLSIRACSAMIIVLTPSSDASSWVQREITLAEKYDKPVFPLWLEGSVDTPNWELFVRTQFHDIRGGKLPDEIFISSLSAHVPRSEGIGKDVTITDKFPPVDVDDDHVYREAIENPPSQPQLNVVASNRRYMIPAIVALVVIGLVVGLLLSPNPEPSEPTNTPPPDDTPAQTTDDVELTEANYLEQMNTWRFAQAPPFAPLAQDEILNDLAENQGSYLYGIAPSDLQDIREHRFLGETDIEDVAGERGYTGEVAIFVEILEGGASLTVNDVITILERRGVADVHSRYSDVGVSLTHNPVTTLDYFVLILGNPNGE